ncbi:EscU/YscU/HrcU family type III secretion system export apparatus switch protein [Legionella clemsonensis]|uniref:Flagellar biosynthetic protein FlhB n=1 Tax=Legionella clemsonensis TaxID=1867846 RepID=A0A222NZK0_9GAMM|nr:EscU/YscU/HrcU family type III secretion system export apparatus switch protein [Legionella clemsonensis]ASQ44975.1 Flagellar biosynthetic protein FlhB [Legionella clemsonensis]
MSKDKTKAVALHYDGKSAPKVTAKGEGFLAEHIIKLAKEHNIPLQQNTPLTELLAQVELNKEIPRNLYLAVAQLLTFLYYMNEKTPQDY